MWTGLVWLRIGTGGELVWMRLWTFGFHEMLGNYRVSKQLGISRVVPSSMELVSPKRQTNMHEISGLISGKEIEKLRVCFCVRWRPIFVHNNNIRARSISVRWFFLNSPLYLRSVPVNTANAVTSCRRELTGTLLYSIGSESSCDLGSGT
jgi:hypothetical protein